MLKVGDKVPDFSVETTAGQAFTLSEHRGKILVVYFFPKAFTPGCTRESKRFRDAYPDYKALDCEVLGVSVDDHATQCEFAESMRVTFPMAADKDKKLSRLFGVLWPILGIDRRVTFVVDGEGVVRGVFSHEFQILKHLDESLALVRELHAKAKG